MSPSEVRVELTKVFRNIFGQTTLELKDEMTASEVPGWDSLTHIDLIVAVEKHFRIKLTTRDVAGLKNVGELASLVEKRLAG